MSQNPKEAEAELDKQYREYKAQFETWKEANKGSIGTDAYDAYVKQFEDWEKDVDKRRRNIRERAEREKREALQKLAEEEEKTRKTQAQKEAEDAEAYLQSQQSYLAHHQAAMEAERAKAQMQTVQYHVATQNYGVCASVLDGVYGATSVVAATVTAPAAGAAAGSTAIPLWGTNKITYDSKDPMHARWGARAAPPHVPPILHSSKIPTSCWMVNEAMQSRKKVLAPQVSRIQPFVPSQAPPSLFSIPTMHSLNGTH